MRDRRGPVLRAERDLVARVSAVYEQWGFEPLDTSALEYADALGKFLPDQDRPNEGVFAFQDDDEQWLSLRYDLTAPLARFVAENFDALPKPYRRWAAGPVWRNEKVGPGRFREFWQCDADTVGAASPAADAEMIAMACEALEAAGLRRGGYVIRVSDRRLLDGALETRAGGAEGMEPARRLKVLRAIDKLDRLGVEGVELLLGRGRKDESGDFTPGAELEPSQVREILNVVTSASVYRAGARQTNRSALALLRESLARSAQGLAGIGDLEEIAATLEALGVGEDQWCVETSVVRGLEYYTGPVYEIELLGEILGEDGKPARFGSVGGGGRYDDLVARFRGERIPATGISIGVSRLAAALNAQGAREEGPVVILSLEADQTRAYFAIAAQLRAAGIKAEVYLGAGKFGAQLKYADKRNAPLAVIIGDVERLAGQASIKDLKLGAALSKGIVDNVAWRKGQPAQVTVARDALVATIVAMLAAQTGEQP